MLKTNSLIDRNVMGLVVWKLGGSLLTNADTPDRIKRLSRESGDQQVLIVPGGGGVADVVRDWARIYSIDDEPAHWIAVRSLSVTRALIATLIPNCREVSSPAEACGCWKASPGPLVLDVEAYLREAEPTDAFPLPHNWHVTSDSIAAWVAARWRADNLVMLKSTPLQAGTTLERARELGLVDDYFPTVATQVARISWCNMLNSDPKIISWLNHRTHNVATSNCRPSS